MINEFIHNISKQYDEKSIESTLINYVYEKQNKQIFLSDKYRNTMKYVNLDLFHKFEEINFPIDIEIIINLFELLVDKETKTENGVVFTPKYISDYISKNTIERKQKCSIIDPSCGCGIFLISAAESLYKHTNMSYVEIFNDCIYGIDIDSNNVRRCKIVIDLFVLMNGEDNALINAQIKQYDSLKADWNKAFNKKHFDYIVGNPPYVNTHDISKDVSNYLKEKFFTTKNGIFNIFYAFIEHAMQFISTSGRLSYIVPNNFLSIKSAENLRSFISKNNYIERIVDFTDNMVFKPVKTYNCIIFLTKKKKELFEYSNILHTDNIRLALETAKFDKLPISALKSGGWNLADFKTLENIEKIENQEFPIGNMIRTGIATLRDNIYIVEYDGSEFFKIINNKRYIIEPDIVQKIYKIPDMDNGCKYIIFPYRKVDKGFEIIKESELKKTVPNAYRYLLSQKEELDKRDKGKKNKVSWYAYGRTQGLSKFGKKLLFPTFARYPHFTQIDDENSLFCNGYAIFDEGNLDFSLLQRILNSSVMNYYVSKTSYSIEGGYYCYQKKYIEHFSIPNFSSEEVKQLYSLKKDEFEKFLICKYGISI